MTLMPDCAYAVTMRTPMLLDGEIIPPTGIFVSSDAKKHTIAACRGLVRIGSEGHTANASLAGIRSILHLVKTARQASSILNRVRLHAWFPSLIFRSRVGVFRPGSPLPRRLPRRIGLCNVNSPRALLELGH